MKARSPYKRKKLSHACKISNFVEFEASSNNEEGELINDLRRRRRRRRGVREIVVNIDLIEKQVMPKETKDTFPQRIEDGSYSKGSTKDGKAAETFRRGGSMQVNEDSICTEVRR